MKAEFQDKDAHASCDTMVANPYVNHVPVLTGGVGRRQLENYYSRYFIPGQPPDWRSCPSPGRSARSASWTSSSTAARIQSRWNGCCPGCRRRGGGWRLPVVVIVSFEGGKMKSEHLYWDQASVLVQLGLLDPAGLPVAGVEVARKALDPAAVPSNL